MRAQQKAMIVMGHPGEMHGLDDLNLALQRGWRVVHVTPMGGAGAGTKDGGAGLCFAAFVVIERTPTAEVEVEEELLEQIDDLPDEVIGGLIDGDAASGDGA